MRYFLPAVFCILLGLISVAGVHAQEDKYPARSLQAGQFAAIADIVEKAVSEGKTPGAVVLIASRGEVVYRRAFGYRTLEPKKIPMTEETIFDLASVTKVVATTTAVMQLAEKGKLDIEAPVARYWPAFGRNGKDKVTVRQLLTHYSGLRPDLSLKTGWSGYENGLKKILSEMPVFPPGTQFVYSDINFEVLGELVRRLSRQPLDRYCAEHIFRPLGMKDTGFTPSSSLLGRIAPTEYFHGKPLCGKAHDPSCYRMGGVAGHAGLFSTADDLSVFAQMLLGDGNYRGKRILRAETVAMMTTPQSPPDKKNIRGFGWDLEAPFVSNREELPPVGAYGHLGYTGTALWIDPVTDTYIIVLTNRVHPDGKGDVKELRTAIKKIVSDAVGPVSAQQVLAKRHSLTGVKSSAGGDSSKGGRDTKMMTGIDVLSAEDFLPLKGLRIGLVSNDAGRDSRGRRTLDLLRIAPGVQLKAIFCPEHGLSGNEDGKVASTQDSATGLPIFSLYGDVRKPTDEMLRGLDALVFDVQDAGVRFYTYISTMGYALEAASKKGIAFYVLDRPNPLTASLVQGPVMDRDMRSFTGYFPLPVRHGMTVGELAEMFNAENRIGANLHVIKMTGYRRSAWFDETGLRWINPSPNLHSLTEAILYPGVALVEGANVSVGRGTDTPFELLGAPWISAKELAGYLTSREIPGVRFTPAVFTPHSGVFRDKECHGVRITLTDRQELNVAGMGIEIVAALHKLYPAQFRLDRTLGMIGSRQTLRELRDGLPPKFIMHQWQSALNRFLDLRSKYLLY